MICIPKNKKNKYIDPKNYFFNSPSKVIMFLIIQILIK